MAMPNLKGAYLEGGNQSTMERPNDNHTHEISVQIL